jgi:hypothetical protein
MEEKAERNMNVWPFDQPPDGVALTTTHVMKEGHDITHVYHDADDHGWQFHFPGEKKASDAMVVAMKTIVQFDPSVQEVADLPPGWVATRACRGAAWTRKENK